MKILLDTHVFVWLQDQPERIGRELQLLEDGANDLLVSAASSWELAIKSALGKVTLPLPVIDYVPSRALASGARLLSISHVHAARVAELPRVHGDPFDRLLVAQAIEEGAVLLTADSTLAGYGEAVRLIGA